MSEANEAKRSVVIGLAGFGTVGGAVYDVLKENTAVLTQRSGVQFRVKTVVCRSLEKARAKVGPETTVTGDWHAVVNDPEIDVAVELMGGIEPAKSYILAAIAAGKHVITANKALLAHHGNEIFAAARAKGVIVAYEAAVAGGVPIIKALREGLAANRIEWVVGIINGTSNFILTMMREKKVSFAEALAACAAGYAEADPTFDVEGVDAAHKLSLISSIAFGTPINFERVSEEGISTLSQEDIAYAENFGYRIKLLGIAKRTAKGIEQRVHPTLVPMRRLLANVDGVMNQVPVLGFSEPDTSVAWLDMDETVSSYYLRITVVDRPGVLAEVSRIFADNAISIECLVQREAVIGEDRTDVVLMTHSAREGNVRKAVAAIEALESVCARIVLLRKEELN